MRKFWHRLIECLNTLELWWVHRLKEFSHFFLCAIRSCPYFFFSADRFNTRCNQFKWLIHSILIFEIKVTLDKLIQRRILHYHCNCIINLNLVRMIIILLHFDLIKINRHRDLSLFIIWTNDIDFNSLSDRLTTNIKEQILNIKRRKCFYFNSFCMDAVLNDRLNGISDLFCILTL